MNPIAALRLARVGLHVATGLALSATVVRLGGDSHRARLRRWWSTRLLTILGIRLRAVGRLPAGGRLIVANHVSWLDVFALSALNPATFVAKSEVRSWPLIGWLSAANGTLFIERDSTGAAARMKQRVAGALAAGRSVALFPEGTSTDGSMVLPFRPALLQAAIDAEREVVPVALRYVDANGAPTATAAYCGEIGFFESLLAIVRTPAMTVELSVLAGIRSTECCRRTLAARSHAAITSRLAQDSGGISADRPSCLRGAPPSGSRPTGSPNPAPAAFLRA